MSTHPLPIEYNAMKPNMRWTLPCLRLSRLLRVILILVFTFTLCLYLLYSGSGHEMGRGLARKAVHFPKGNHPQEACHRPDLEPFAPELARFVKEMMPLDCKRDIDWVLASNGSLEINPHLLEKEVREIRCRVIYMDREDDFKSNPGKRVTLSSAGQRKTRLENDFFWVKCIGEKGKGSKKWDNVMAAIHRNERAFNRSSRLNESSGNSKKRSPKKLNVLMFGLDSMSRMHYMRKLPKTYEYLTQILNATVLKIYNIVGDGTPQALIPMLTGSSEPELPETRKRKADAQYVDVYPFVWSNYSEKGYITGFAEDMQDTGIFTYRLKGFNETPTDHYMRQFYVEASKEFRKHSKLCLGSTTRHMVMLNWLRDVYRVYPNSPKFVFGFHGELSHDDFNLVQSADRDLKDWLTELKESGILENTILIMMSDHGNRFADIRELLQGKEEERLPFMSIVLPSWFPRRYPNAYQNLRVNAESRLTTPFDIHATLITILTRLNAGEDVPVAPKEEPADAYKSIPRSLSLFQPILKYRNCRDADIEAHWCTCLKWISLDINDPIVIEAAQTVIDFINELTEGQRSLCTKLTLDRITRAQNMAPNQALLAYKQPVDYDGFIADLSGKTQGGVKETVYQIQLTAYPSGGIYEASLRYKSHIKVFNVKESEISRINQYSNQPHCVFESHPNLRKYCYCKIQNE